MEIKLQKLPKSRVRFFVTVSALQMAEYFNQAAQRLAAGFLVEGFRPGKAPVSLVQQQLGEEKIVSEAIEIALPLTYYQAIKEKGIVPIESPQIEIKEYGRAKPLVYQAEVDVMPEVKLGDYKNLSIKQMEHKVSVREDEIEMVLRQLQRQTADLKPVSRAAQKGDFVEIDFETFLDKQPLAGGKSQNHPLVIGQGQFFPDFEKKLIGMKVGERKDFSVYFPKDFHQKEIAGKKVDFQVRLKSLKEIILPKIDDAWAARLGEKNLKNLRESIKKSLLVEAEKRQEEKVEQEIIEQLVKNSLVEVPLSLISKEAERMFQGIVQQIESKGLNFQDYLKALKKTKEELLKEIKEVAERNIAAGLILNTIKTEEKIQCSEEEIDKEIQKLKEKNFPVKDKEDRQRIKDALEVRKTLERIKKIIMKNSQK